MTDNLRPALICASTGRLANQLTEWLILNSNMRIAAAKNTRDLTREAHIPVTGCFALYTLCFTHFTPTLQASLACGGSRGHGVGVL